jgi:hypothetical protein
LVSSILDLGDLGAISGLDLFIRLSHTFQASYSILYKLQMSKKLSSQQLFQGVFFSFLFYFIWADMKARVETFGPPR